MIEQSVQVKPGSMVANFGNGDIAVGARFKDGDPNKVIVEFSALKEEHKIGDKVNKENVCCTPIIMEFDNIQSIEVIMNAFESAIALLSHEKLRNIIAPSFSAENREFTIPIKSIQIPKNFTNPSPVKIMECLKKYQQTGDIGKNIYVDDKKVLTDGYVGLLVLDNENAENVKVIAPDGITVEIRNSKINFPINKIGISWEMDGSGNSRASYLKIKDCTKVYNYLADTPADAVAILKTISKEFVPEFIFMTKSPMNAALAKKMSEYGLEYKFLKDIENKG